MTFSFLSSLSTPTFGSRRRLQVFVLCLVCAASAGQAAEKQLQRTLPLLAKSAVTYTKKRKCFSCHHQALTTMALVTAKQKGHKIDQSAVDTQAKFTHGYFSRRRQSVAGGKGVPGGAYTTGYALVALSLGKQPADQTTDAMVSYLYQLQKPDGSWRIRTHRPPLEDSDFTATALSIRGVKLYARNDHKKELTKRIIRARKWLVDAGGKAKTHEDQAFRLFGLLWSGAGSKEIAVAARAILKSQQEDGGWKQLTKSKSTDAYATGQAVVSLVQAGKIPASDKRIQKALAYLKNTQRKDGSWLVKSRSKPFQTQFNSNFPHGKNQWISISGTCWATMALLQGEKNTSTKR